MGKLEKLDVPTESNFMKWVKKIAYIVTILTTLSGGILGILSFLREIKDPKAQAGYNEHSVMLEENSKNIRENREEIRFIYKSLIQFNNISPVIKNRELKLPKPPIQKPKKWDNLPIQQMILR